VGPRTTSNSECKRLQVVGLFAPKVQCEWAGPPAGDPYPDHKQVLVTPLVADFKLTTQTGELGSIHPSIVITTYNCLDGSSGQETGCFGVIRVLDGNTCRQQYSMTGATPTSSPIGSVTPAIADLDGDGRPDIVTSHIGGGVMGFKYDAASNQFVEMWGGYSTWNNANFHWNSVAVHDLDGDAVPEIIQVGVNAAVYSNTGAQLSLTATSQSYAHYIHPVLADVDGDGTVELVDGRYVWKFDKALKVWKAVGDGTVDTTRTLGQVALADFGTFGESAGADDRAALDGKPEVAVVTSGNVRVQTLGGRIVFGPVAIPNPGAHGSNVGGAPTVGDFDGDGRVEIGVAGATAYAVLDPDCVGGAASSDQCPTTASTVPTTGILWFTQSQDQSSNQTGSSVFDFEGDGKAEVVYADECFSRVYDGRSGDVLFSAHHTSCTWYENPVVVDADGDFRSEIVIGSNQSCNVTCPAVDPIHDGMRCETDADCPGVTLCGKEAPADKYGRCRCTQTSDCASSLLTCTDPIAGPSAAGRVCRASHPVGVKESGVKVLADSSDRWVGSRMIWNQHAYAVTNVKDDGKIPSLAEWKQNWKEPKLNNFRMNVQGDLGPEQVPDITSSGNSVEFTCGDLGASLRAKICNRGTAPVASGIPVTFYKGTRAPENKACTAVTSRYLAPGSCEVILCIWSDPAYDPVDIVISADDDGTGTGQSTECEEANNLGTLKGVSCAPILN
jgi:hypothetical protein